MVQGAEAAHCRRFSRCTGRSRDSSRAALLLFVGQNTMAPLDTVRARRLSPADFLTVVDSSTAPGFTCCYLDDNYNPGSGSLRPGRQMVEGSRAEDSRSLQGAWSS